MCLKTPCLKPARRQLQRLPRRKNARLVAILRLAQPIGVGDIKLSDGALLRLKILIVDVKEIGFSPFGGVNFYANVTGGVYVSQTASESSSKISRSSQVSSLPETAGNCSTSSNKTRRGAGGRPELTGRIRGEGCSRRVARNTHYKSPTNEPI